jgi:uncharacterized protein HemX
MPESPPVEHVASIPPPSFLQPAPEPPRPSPDRHLSAPHISGRWILIALCALTVIALAGGLWYFAQAAHANRQAAAQWRGRSIAVSHALTARNALLDRRTRALTNSANQIDGLNDQVRIQEDRLDELASEKAQVEDQRGLLRTQSAALASLAVEQGDCSSQLMQLLGAFANGDYTWVQINGSSIGQTCGQARADLDAFVSKYGRR